MSRFMRGAHVKKIRIFFGVIFLWVLCFVYCPAMSQEATNEASADKTGPTAPTATSEDSSELSEQDVSFEEEIDDSGEGSYPEIQVSSFSDDVNVPLGPGMRLNLQDCLQMALFNNREIKSQDYDLQAAQYKLQEAKMIGMPVIDYEFHSAPAPTDVDHAITSFFDGDITFFQKGKIALGVPLYTFGKLALAQKLAKKGIEAERERKTDKQNDILLKVKKLYYGILLGFDVRILLQDALRHMDSEIERRESTKEPTDPVQLVRLKLFKFELLKRIGETEKKVALAKEGLRIQLGLKQGTIFSLDEKHLRSVPFNLENFETYLKASQRFRPQKRLVEIGVQASELKYQLEKRTIAPDIGVGGFYEFGRTTSSIAGLVSDDDFNDPFNFNRAGVGLRVKGELNIKGYYSKVKQAEAEYFKAAFGKLAADEGLALDLKSSYLTVLQSKRDMDNAREAKKIARQYVFVTKSNLEIGIGDPNQFSDALQAYLLSQARCLESIFDYNVAMGDLEVKAGGVAQVK